MISARPATPPETRDSSLPNHAFHAIWAPGRAYSAAQVDKGRIRVLSARATAAALLGERSGILGRAVETVVRWFTPAY